MSIKRNNGIKFFDITETEPQNIITMDGLKNSTTDEYNKSDYKWDPQLKKTVYVGKKATTNKQEQKGREEAENKPNNKQNENNDILSKIKNSQKQVITDNFVKFIRNDNMDTASKFMGSVLAQLNYIHGDENGYNKLNELKNKKEFKEVIEWAKNNGNESERDEQIKKLHKVIESVGNENKKEMLKKIKEVASGKKAQSRENAYYYMQYADSQATNKNNTEKEKETWRDLHMKLVDKYHDYR